MSCPEPVRLRCMRRNSGEFGITPEELATLLAPFLPGGSGTVKQIVTTRTGDFINTTTIIPQDDTIPQITEGDLILSISITPIGAGNNLLVKGSSLITAANNNLGGSAALFRDAGPDAISAVEMRPDLTTVWIESNAFLFADVPAINTNPTTFSMRTGPNAAGNVNINGVGSRVFGGVASTWMEVIEYEP